MSPSFRCVFFQVKSKQRYKFGVLKDRTGSSSSSSASSSSSQAMTGDKLLKDVTSWLCFVCGNEECPARLYICLESPVPGEVKLTIRRSREPHVHKATGCTEHSRAGPCSSCQSRNRCDQLPCLVATTACLTPGSLASFHELSVAQTQLAAGSANTHSPTVLYQVRNQPIM